MNCPEPTWADCPNEIWESIISHLKEADNKTLLSCRAMNKIFRSSVDKKTKLWSRMSLQKAVSDKRIDICQLIVRYAEDKNPPNSLGVTPLHTAAEKGHFEIFQLILQNAQDKNPMSRHQPPNEPMAFGHSPKSNLTPLHMAAGYGHEDICKFQICF